jgi:transcriptional regulator GlxA family with amidase domain
VKSLPKDTLVTSVCTGSWILAQAGLLDNLPATSRKEAGPNEMVPLDRLKLFCPTVKPNTARVVDVGRIITAGGIASGMELGFYLLERHGYDEKFISEVARIMEYNKARELFKADRYIEK